MVFLIPKFLPDPESGAFLMDTKVPGVQCVLRIGFSMF